ncbi:hypothetical protein ILYODFUR_032279, partial [Ilyodon furcidens]
RTVNRQLTAQTQAQLSHHALITVVGTWEAAPAKVPVSTIGTAAMTSTPTVQLKQHPQGHVEAPCLALAPLPVPTTLATTMITPTVCGSSELCTTKGFSWHFPTCS